MEKQVNIGHSIQVKGELSGSEDLVIDGAVEGKIQLKDHDLTIGSTGRITAEIQAKTVVVVGQVKGNITAGNRIEITETGSVLGDLHAPRISLADGATFRGAIDMGARPKASSGESRPAASEAPRAAGAPDGSHSQKSSSPPSPR
jgi:cytoskeletal protein CcmA (bactofilin family)